LKGNFTISHARTSTSAIKGAIKLKIIKNYPTPNQTQNPQEILPLTTHPS